MATLPAIGRQAQRKKPSFGEKFEASSASEKKKLREESRRRLYAPKKRPSLDSRMTITSLMILRSKMNARDHH